MRLPVAFGCLLAAVSPAFAADILPGPAPIPPPVYAPGPPPPPYNWSGFYVGGDGGYGWGSFPFSMPVTDPLGFTVATLNGDNFKGYDVGGHAGYNFQHGMWVGGLELDMSATGIQGTNSITGTDTPNFLFPPGTTVSNSITEKFDYLASARPRIGFLPFETLLLYGTGGLGWTHVTVSTSSMTVEPAAGGSSAASASAPYSLFGWVAGGGVEASLASVGMPYLLARVEYLHYDFGSLGSSSSSTLGGSSSVSTSGQITVNVVRGGLSFKF